MRHSFINTIADKIYNNSKNEDYSVEEVMAQLSVSRDLALLGLLQAGIKPRPNLIKNQGTIADE